MRRFALIALLAMGCSSPQGPTRSTTGSETPSPAETSGETSAETSGSGGELRADGQPCLAASECQSGICEGEGCGDDTPGVCAPAMRACTRDLRAYCGCDGTTFRTSGSCPGSRFSSRGECPAP